MKRLIAATIAVALSAPAFASDLSVKDTNTTTDYSTTHGWTGVYFGAHAGYGWNNHDIKTTEREVTPGTPATCTGDAQLGKDGKCYVTVDVPAVSSSCKDGYGMKEDGACYAITQPAKPERCNSDRFGNDYSLVSGKCYKIEARDPEGNPTELSGNDNPFVHENAKEAELGDESVDSALNPAKEATTKLEEKPDAYVDAKTTITNTLLAIDPDGIFGGIHAGADYQVPNGSLVFGVFGDFNLADNDQIKSDVTVNDGNSYLIAGRVGALINNKTLIYALAGYGWQDVTYTNGGKSIDKTFGHVVAGGGLEYKFTKELSVGLEGQHWFESDEKIASGVNDDGSSYSVTDARSDTRVLGRVSYRLGDN